MRLRTRARPAAHALRSRPRSARRTPRPRFSRSHSCLKDSAVTMQLATSLPEGPHVAQFVKSFPVIQGARELMSTTAFKPGVLVQTCYPSTGEAEAG